MSPLGAVLWSGAGVLAAVALTVIVRAVLTTGSSCRCGHSWYRHEHLHSETYCALGRCECPVFRRAWRWRA